MSKSTRWLVMFLALLALPLALVAQDEEAAETETYAYGTYLECDVTEEWLADEIVDQLFAPVYDAAVADGSINAWGWLAHHTGGNWRRVLYHTASTFDGLLESGNALIAMVNEANPDAARKFSQICNRHDDYIWRAGVGSGAPGSLDVATNPSKVGVSTYFQCDMTREERADELLAMFKPIYDRQVAEGNLSGWGWMQHQVGGEYRRLLNLRGADTKGVVGAWGSIIEEIGEQYPEEGNELTSICPTHTDYIWGIVH